MKSRLALTSLLVLGLLMSTTGVGLAISGSSGSGNAAQFVYPQNQPEGEEGGDDGVIGGTVDGGGPDDPVAGSGNDPAAGAANESAQTQATADDGGELPFTGFLAIPLLIGGVVLTVTGFALRRRL